GIPLGKFSVDKVHQFGVAWAKHLDKKYLELHFASTSGLEAKEDCAAAEDSQEVVLGSLRTLSRDASDDKPDSVASTLKRGDLVTVVRRMSWGVPYPGNEEYRKDLVEGTEGVIEGWADVEQRQVLLKVSLELPNGSSKDVTHQCYPRNLQLTSDHKLQMAGASEKDLKGADVKESKDAKKGPSSTPAWLLVGSDPAQVKVEKQWHKLSADNDKLNRAFWLRSRVGVCLAALYETLPAYTDKDLVVCHRQNDKGVWRDEVWTSRDFAPQELALAPLSSQLKDTHLTHASNAVVGIPKHGRGAHPDSSSLALDGRTRTTIAKEGSIDSSEHSGSIYWLVARTSDPSIANMTLESVSWEHNVSLSTTFKKMKVW
ncbi:MAG: hypothetical protein GY701_19500, partial [Sulfitobacter sp.]|nr:hypothetical protein [Sulfitobacter sp.]